MGNLFKLSGFKLALLITFAFIGFKLVNEYGLTSKFKFLDLVEYKAMDEKFNARKKEAVSGQVVIVSADEKSISTFGQWPWPHKVFAEILEKLTAAGVKVVGFDVIFAEYDTSDVACKKIVDRVAKAEGPDQAAALEKTIDPVHGCDVNDASFAAAIAKSPTVLGYFFFSDDDVKSLDREIYLKGEKVVESSKIQIVVVNQAQPVPVPRMPGVQVNIPPLSSATARMGYFTQTPDPDGLYRSVPMFIRMGENYYPSLSVAVLKEALGGNIMVTLGTEKLMDEEGRVAKLMLGQKDIPVDESGRFLVKYYGPANTFRHISAVDVWSGKVPAAELKDKIVLFGVTTTGVFDLRPIPFQSENYPGVEIHANVIENILREDYLVRPNMLKAIELLLMLAIGVIAGLFLTRFKLQYGMATLIVVTFLYLWVDFQFMFKNGLYTKIIPQLMQILVLMIAISVYRYFTEERDKGRIRKIFSTYVTKSVVEEVLRDPTKLQLGGQKKVLTVFFSDIRGFTSISEKLTPEQLVHQLNEYLTPMTNIVFKHEGTLDKYMGDAIMAIYGAPLDQPDHAARCCNAALDMMEELKKLRASWKARGLPEINIGIGINTGEMIVGNMGSDVKFEYTVIGDNVNLGSRLEGVNKEYGTNIIISEYTRGHIAGQFAVRELDLIRVKGKKEPVKIFELLGRGAHAAELQVIIDKFEAALQLFRTQKWDEAGALFAETDKARGEHGDPPSKKYLERIAYLRENPPDVAWDGVWVMKTK